MDQQVVRVDDLQLVGDQTQLSINGTVSLGVRARGSARER
jgi:hypothetical protein